jgi:hypothetical protein
MSEATFSKQSVGGFKVCGYQVKKSKEGDKVKLVLEADVEEITSGTFDVGSVMKALLHHQSGDTEVGLSLLMS